MANRLSWQKNASQVAGQRSNRNVLSVHEDCEHRADNSASGLPDSGLRTFGATQQIDRAVGYSRHQPARYGMLLYKRVM